MTIHASNPLYNKARDFTILHNIFQPIYLDLEWNVNVRRIELF